MYVEIIVDKVKVKLLQCMKKDRDMEVKKTFQILALHGYEWSASCSGCFTLRKRHPDIFLKNESQLSSS
jgi:hypothetical protein